MLRTRTADGVALSGVLVSQANPSPSSAIVVSHGITNHVRKPIVARSLRRLSRIGDVLAFDLRGHGSSGGRSTVGDREVLDIDAAVAAAHRFGYRSVVTLGFSLGASVALRHAALCGGVDAVVAVSSPARWFVRDTTAMRRVHWLLESPIGRVVSPAVGVRLGQPWRDRVPLQPLEVVGRIAPTPLLLVQGTHDHYFPEEHGRALARAAGAGAELWVEQGMAHAESAMTPQRVDRIAGWIGSITASSAPAAHRHHEGTR